MAQRLTIEWTAGMATTSTRSALGVGLPATGPGLPSPLAGCPGGGNTLPRQPGTPRGGKDDLLDETFIDVSPPSTTSHPFLPMTELMLAAWIKS